VARSEKETEIKEHVHMYISGEGKQKATSARTPLLRDKMGSQLNYPGESFWRAHAVRRESQMSAINN
jgi:hypothetical protein